MKTKILSGCGLFLTYLCFPSLEILQQHKGISCNLVTLQGMNEEMKQEMAAISLDIEAMKSKSYQEHVIRDVMGYQKENEITIILDNV